MTRFHSCRQRRNEVEIFPAITTQLVDPATGSRSPATFCKTAGLTIDPMAQGLLPFIPLPNVTPAGCKRTEFSLSLPSTLNDSDDLNIRMNQALGGTSNNRRQREPAWAAKQLDLRLPLSRRQRES